MPDGIVSILEVQYGGNLQKNIDEGFCSDINQSNSSLAHRAEVGSAARQHQAPYWRLATAARQAGALVNAVLELKESALAIGIDIIGDRGTAKPDGVAQHLAQRESKALQFLSGKAVGPPPRPNACLKQALIGVDVAHPR